MSGSVDLLQKQNYGEVEKRVKEAVLISLQKDLGTDFFTEGKDALKDYYNNDNVVSTGWKDIDSKLYGGFKRTELNIFAASSGKGKSLFLQNLALNWASAGLNIVYISLELSEGLLASRLSAMASEYSTRDVFKHLEDASIKIAMKKKNGKWGNIQLKYMKQGSNCNDVFAYLKEYEIQTGKRVDGVCIDYLDLLMPNNNRINVSDTFTKDKYVSEEMRGMANELNILCATASQLNRSAMEDTDPDQHHIAGGISKINTADNVIVVDFNDALRNKGQYKVKFIKTRSSSGVGSTVYLGFDAECLRITDLDQSAANADDGDETETQSPITAGLKRKSKITNEDSKPKTVDLRSLVNKAKNYAEE